MDIIIMRNKDKDTIEIEFKKYKGQIGQINVTQTNNDKTIGKTWTTFDLEDLINRLTRIGFKVVKK